MICDRSCSRIKSGILSRRMDGGGIVGVCAVLCLLVSSVYSLELTTESVELSLNEGQNVVLPCDVRGGSLNFYSSHLTWYKMVGEKTAIINIGNSIQTPFQATDRYRVDYNAGDEESSMNLHIDGQTLADNGTYRCVLSVDNEEQGKVDHSVTVLAAIDSLNLTATNMRSRSSGRKVFDFDELEESSVTCIVRGGNPKPSLKLLRGKVDITDEMTWTESMDVTGLEELQTTIYTRQISTENFRPLAEYSGKNLKCIAEIGENPEMRRQDVGQMNVKHPPKVTGCEENIYAARDAQNFVIDCKVSGNPVVEVSSVHWMVGEENTTMLTHGEELDGVTANITMNEDGSFRAMLTIHWVNETSLQKFSLRSSNEINQDAHYDIYLIKGTTTTSTTVKTTTKQTYVVNTGPMVDRENGACDHSANALLPALAIILTALCLAH